MKKNYLILLIFIILVLTIIGFNYIQNNLKKSQHNVQLTINAYTKQETRNAHYITLTNVAKTPTPTKRNTSTPTLIPTNVTINENILGAWLWEYEYEKDHNYLIVIRYENGQYIEENLHNDGSNAEKLLKTGTDSIGRTMLSNNYGDYMIINDENELLFYDNDGFFKRLYPLNLYEVCSKFPVVCD